MKAQGGTAGKPRSLPGWRAFPKKLLPGLALAFILLGGALVFTGTMNRPPLSPAGPASAPAESAPPPLSLPLSSLSLPVTVPLSGVRQAVNARLPTEFARVNQQQSVLGGAASVQITGTVRRTGDIRLLPVGSGQTLQVEVPLLAHFGVRPEFARGGWATRLENSLTRDFGGEALVRLNIRPFVGTDWEAGAEVGGELEWTDPLAVELLPGTRVSVQGLAERAVRAQLERVTAEVARAVRESAALRERAGALWTRAQQPWPLPLEGSGAGPAYAQLMLQRLSVAGLGVRDDALSLTLQAEGFLRAELGPLPPAPARPAPLPQLTVLPQAQPGELHLRVPIRLPLGSLALVAEQAARARLAGLRLPAGAQVQLEKLTLTPAGGQHLNLAARLRLSGLGFGRTFTVDLRGRPFLRPDGRVVTLENVEVRTRGDGLGSRVLGWLADARLEQALAGAARFDLGPRLSALEDTVAARLPFSPVPGVRLRGDLGGFRLDDLRVTGDALEVTAAADGALDVLVDAGGLVR